MNDQSNMRLVNTKAATVKMTIGVPVITANLSDSDEEEEFIVGGAGGETEIDIEENSKLTSSESPPAYTARPNASDEVLSNSSQCNNLDKKDVRLNNENLCNYTMSTSSALRQVKENDVHSTQSPRPGKSTKFSENDCVKREPHSGIINGTSSGNSMFDTVVSKSRYKNGDTTTTNIQADSDIPASVPVLIPDKVKHVVNQVESTGSSLDNDFQLEDDNCDNLHRLSHSAEEKKPCIIQKSKPSITKSQSFTAISLNKPPRTRINPFNRELVVEEDHFSDSCDNFFRTERRSSDSTRSSSISHNKEWWHETFKQEVTFAELGISEDHFSHPSGTFGLSDIEELELAIDNCKELIRDAPQGSDKQKNLVMKLVQLRVKLQEIREGPEPVAENVKVILSHKMMLKTSRTSKYYCEKCNGVIWGMLQAWYRCIECGYRCHEKCLQQILRTCAKARVIQNPTLIMDLCPKEDNGLACQSYRCGECRLAISFKSGMSEPRLCDYTGRYYCEFCHWNDTSIIPARVLHNWDFTGHKVCRASKQFLKLMQRKAVIRIQDVNPMLFVYVDQLNEIKKLREEMMVMKKYILSCPSAMVAKLLLLLQKRQHFVESSDRYSMQDLLDAEDVLLPELVSVHSTWAQHIKVDCELCQGRGFCCELCGDQDVLFPFDSIAVVCAKCANVSHRHCFSQKGYCPRCVRREKRKGK